MSFVSNRDLKRLNPMSNDYVVKSLLIEKMERCKIKCKFVKI